MNWPLFLAIFLVIEGLHSAGGVISPGDFIDGLFNKYGTNGTINLDEFTSLLKSLGIGKDVGNSSAGSIDKNCFSGGNLLNIFSPNTSSVNKIGFQSLCPAIVQQMDSKSCAEEDTVTATDTTKESKSKAWGYGILSVAIISCASLFGAFVVPFMNHNLYKKLLLFMVSLAVGVLGGSGIFHLLPKTLSAPAGKEGRIYKLAVVVGGIYFFFFMEYIMKLYIRYKDDDAINSGHSHSHCIANGKNKNEIPGLGVSQAQLGLYKLNDDSNQQHTAGGLIIANDKNQNIDPSILGDVCGSTQGHKTPNNTNSDVSVQCKEGECEKRHIEPVAWMIVIGDGVHNFVDGLAIGAAYSTSTVTGLSTSIAIFCEELPHELGDFAVLLNSGMTYKQALFFNFLSALSCFLGLIVGILLGYSTSAVRWIYALAAGMFLYISLVDMLQEATEMSFKEGKGSMRKSIKMFALQSFGMLLGFGIMFVLGVYHSQLKKIMN